MIPSPPDATRFGIRHLFYLTGSIAFGLAIAVNVPGLGPLFAGSVMIYWLGMLMLFVSDATDQRTIDQRHFVSAMLSLVGALTCFFSIMLGGTFLLAITIMALIGPIG